MHEPALISLIQDRYAAIHGAIPAGDYPAYLTIGVPQAPLAALGFRHADAGPLFLEAYLDRPIEIVLGERFARPVPRARIVELATTPPTGRARRSPCGGNRRRHWSTAPTSRSLF